MLAEKRTKIVCTIGPASEARPKLKRMVRSGMNMARLNLSHGNHSNHRELIRNIRSVARETRLPIGIIGDLQGPKIRIGELPEKGLKVVKGQIYEVPVTYRNLYKDLKRDHRILLDDGLMEGKFVSGKAGLIKFKVVNGGTLTSHKGMNFPDSTLTISSITDKDKVDAEFCVHQGLHYVALSFVTDPKDVRRMRRILKAAAKKGDPIPKIIAKIEKHEAVKRFDEILQEVDAIMVARGDLGIEIPAEQVPLIQKEIIDKCRDVAKPVIVATQMLDSMIRNPRPTRAEVSDVANAVIDHTDAVMLSGESATGKYPVESVQTMAKIVKETEDSPYDDVPVQSNHQLTKLVQDAVSNAANLLAHTVDAKLIIVATLSGNAARMVSRFRPELPIFAVTDSEFVRHQLNLSWAVFPIAIPRAKDIEALISRSVSNLKRTKEVKAGQKVILLAGQPVGKKVNFVEVKEI